MAVADVYDALISRRCYKPAFPHERAMELIREQRGTAFDPEVLDAFFSIEPVIVSIAARFRDDEASGVPPVDLAAIAQLPGTGGAADLP